MATANVLIKSVARLEDAEAGLRRAGFDVASRRSLKTAYQILFRRGLRLEDALGETESDRRSLMRGATQRRSPLALVPPLRPQVGPRS